MSNTHVLIVHHEAQYFAGAEKMLGYFLEEAASFGLDVSVAAVAGSRAAEIIPPSLAACWLPGNVRFSLPAFFRQARALRGACQTRPFDVIHGWAARDWELTALAALLTRRPALGTLHDHPKAPFISRARRGLMFGSARAGLRRVVCVSEAVRQACLEAGYRPGQLQVVHNGLPRSPDKRTLRPTAAFRMGFLGQFSERKGLKGLFQILSELAALTDAPWQMLLAGQPHDEAGRRLVQELQTRFSAAPWWPRVEWLGWVKQPESFLASLDTLICPSSEFDPFPTVLLEAGRAGVAVLAARVGGIPEIVEESKTGWLFEAQAWPEAARQLKRLLESPGLVREAGRAAKKRVEDAFAIRRMLDDYLRIYTALSET
jgi:glycosyltransferase involved in cell wall biosynthesis